MKQTVSVFLILAFCLSLPAFAKTIEVYNLRGKPVAQFEAGADEIIPAFIFLPTSNLGSRVNAFNLPWGKYMLKEQTRDRQASSPKPRDPLFFYDATQLLLPLVETDTGSIIVADFDGDGLDDIFEYMGGWDFIPENQPRLLIRQPGGGFVDEAYARLPDIHHGGFYAFAIDVQNDGSKDILMIQYTFISQGRNDSCMLLLNDGTGFFTPASEAMLPWIYAVHAAVADLNGDGFDDIVFLVIDQALNRTDVQIWIKEPGSGFVNETASRLPTDQMLDFGTWQLQTLDINGNGHQDIILINDIVYDGDGYEIYDGKPLVLINQGNGFFQFPGQNPLAGIQDFIYRFYQIDYDQNGAMDLLVTHFSVNNNNPSLCMYRNHGGSFLYDMGVLPFIYLHHNDVLIHDFNGDGFPDIILACVDWGENSYDMYLENSSAVYFSIVPDVLPAILDFTVCLSFIDINLGALPDIMVGNSGANFGEDGQNRIYLNSSTSSQTDPIQSPGSLSLYPNPFSKVLSLQIKDVAATSAAVYNLKGQRIKSWNIPAQSITWQGEDENGRRVAPGIYFFRIKTTRGELIRKVLLMRE